MYKSQTMRYKRFHSIKLCILFLFITSVAAGQNFNKERGLPFIKNYSASEYNAHEQNFDIVQDKNGLMYFANFSGILEFDGTEWRKITTASGMRVLSLDVNEEGTVFAGGLFDFGYVEHTEFGESKFVSLLDSTDVNIGMIFKVICGKEAVYFFSENTMYTYKDEAVSKTSLESKALNAFLSPLNNTSDELLVFFERDFSSANTNQNGLALYKNNSFQKISDRTSAQIVDLQTVFLNTDRQSVILGTSNQGLFVLRGNSITDFNVDINQFIKEKGHTCGVQISEREFALGTFTGGIIISDETGKQLRIIDKNSLLADESINDLFLDTDKSLWAATNNGISKIEVNWYLSFIDNINSGLEGKVLDIKEYNNTFWFATDKGLFRLDGSYIRQVSSIEFAVWDLEVIQNKLIAGCTKGLYIIQDNIARSTSITDFTFSLCVSQNEPNTLYTGHNAKINIISFQNNSISIRNTINTVEGDIYKLFESNDGSLYAEISPGRIFKYDLNNLSEEEIQTDQTLISLRLNKIKDQIFFSSEKGLYYYNTAAGKTEPFEIFPGEKESDKMWMNTVFEIDENTFVITDGEQKNTAVYSLSSEGVKTDQTALLPIAGFPVQAIAYSPETNIIWLGGSNGLILFNHKASQAYESKYKTLIRSVQLIENDSLLQIENDDLTVLNFNQNSLKFKFSAPVYVSRGKINYRYILEGFDKDTSDWTDIPYKDYTNIPSGTYKFTVEAKNEFGKLLNQDHFEFEVQIPMYRRWWAFIIYVTGLLLIIRVYMNWRVKTIEKERIALENTVKERTEEIAQSKEEIETQRDELYKQKQEIVDSINYAQRIQAAVLPSDDIMQDVLHDHFVFYRPRDIVSGDFYWIKQIKNFSFAVAADCTGHGVPGAFMSMLGSSFLNEIVTSRTLDSPGEILNKLRNKVKKSLHQKGEEGEQKDGMDISLIIIDRETLELQFSGAYNSLLIIRKKPDFDETKPDAENFEIFKLKADRQPIGIYIYEKEFTNHTFQLEKGDIIYAMSDGYVDQFGGDTGGKFKSIRFKNLLLSIQDKTMAEQNAILGRTFNKWKRDIDQVDDVLVMGIKI
jgi:serine phosphatase RsbU (regulator of sigma subunit)/sugar lactone lactonase YvrE